MSDDLQTWKCDRCHATQEWPEGFWPKRWTIHELGAIRPEVTHGGSLRRLQEVVLCPECSSELMAWWDLPIKVLEIYRAELQ